MFHIVVAFDLNRGIGKGGALPWPKLRGDLIFYRELTTCTCIDAVKSRYALADHAIPSTFVSFLAFHDYLSGTKTLPEVNQDCHNAVIMGRRTWDSLPKEFQPLPNRLNIIISRHGLELSESETAVVTDFSEALRCAGHQSAPYIFVVGGGQIYDIALQHPNCHSIYATVIENSFECDTFFPLYPHKFDQSISGHTVNERSLRYHFSLTTLISSNRSADR